MSSSCLLNRWASALGLITLTHTLLTLQKIKEHDLKSAYTSYQNYISLLSKIVHTGFINWSHHGQVI